MFLDSASAKALFAIVLASAEGTARLDQEKPLNAVERGDLWLVTGSPHDDAFVRARFVMHDMFFDKRTAEVKGLHANGRLIPSEGEASLLSKILSPEQFASLSRPVTDFEPDGIERPWIDLYGGVVPTAAAAVEYATVLMRTKPAWAKVVLHDLVARERNKVWHVTLLGRESEDLLTISKTTGKLLSGDL